MKKIVSVLLVTHEQTRTGCARGSRALRTALLLALTFTFAGTDATERTLHVVKDMDDDPSIKANTPSNWTIVGDAE